MGGAQERSLGEQAREREFRPEVKLRAGSFTPWLQPSWTTPSRSRISPAGVRVWNGGWVQSWVGDLRSLWVASAAVAPPHLWPRPRPTSS